MDIVLDVAIDNELRRLLEAIMAIECEREEAHKLLENRIITASITEKFSNIVTINHEFFFKKYRNYLHIILYNYAYAEIIGDEFLNAIDYVNLVENETLAHLLQIIENHADIKYYLFLNYIKILLNPELLETITQHHDCYQNISWQTTWPNLKPDQGELVTDKLKDVLFSLRDYADYAEADLKSLREPLYLDFLKRNYDFFALIPTYFNSVEEYLQYKPLLVQMLYFDTYFYLDSKSDLSKQERVLAMLVENRIWDEDTNILPENDYLILQMLECFYDVNLMKNVFKQEHPRELKNIQNLIRKKANKILFLEYY